MATINGKALVKDGKPLDGAYSNGQLVYGRNLLLGTAKGVTGVGSNSINLAFGYYALAGDKKVSDLYHK